MAITKTNRLSMTGGGVPMIVRLSQYDADFTLIFELYSTDGTFTIPSGTTAEVRGTKNDGKGYSASAALDITNKKVTVTGDQQMTAVPGKHIFELTLWKSNKELNSANFILDVEPAALDRNTIVSESKIMELLDVTDRADEIIDAADLVVNAIDPTLTQAGRAADAKATGDLIGAISDSDIIHIDKASMTKLAAYFTGTGLKIATSDNDVKLLYFACDSNTTYKISKVSSARFRIGYTTVTPANNVSVAGFVDGGSATSATITTGSNAAYVVVYYYDGANDTLSESAIFSSVDVTTGGEDITAVDKVARADKVDKQQAAADAGKAMVVGSDGILVPTAFMDSTLTQEGKAADAKVVGDAITDLDGGKVDKQQSVADAGKAMIVNNNGILVPTEITAGLSDEAKVALLNCIAHVAAWTDQYAQDYYDDLYYALYGGSRTYLTATLNLGTHEVYPTDNIESLRNYLTVTLTEEETVTPVTEYTLQGSISAVGTATVTVAYGNYSDTVDVPVVANTSGILYDWDFTKSLTDSRQVLAAVLGTGEACDIPGKSEGTTPPVRSSAGVTFSDAQQWVRLFATSVNTSNLLKDKTVQIDVASFDHQYTGTLGEYYGMRFLTMGNPEGYTGGDMAFDAGFSYVKGWSTLDLGWKTIFRNSDGDFTISNTISTNKNIINGHTVGVYFASDGTEKIYIDGVSQGTTNKNLFTHNLYGLEVGNGARPAYGGCFYNAVITGVRIYDGDVA